MFKSSYISFEESGTLNPLLHDYLSGNEKLKKFYSYFPDKKGFEQILLRNNYDSFKRPELVSILIAQAKTTSNSNPATLNNIQLLAQEKTFTVVTGHQLCLFTGPLYFLHKIFTIINLAEELKKEFPSCNFVPVYWLAGEDHDFEEVNHFHVFGKKLLWQTDQKGPVGEFNTTGLADVAAQLKEILGHAKFAGDLLSLFDNAYLKHNDLKSATRFLVNELFGKYGLVVADGSDRHFKEQAKEIFRKDFFEERAFLKVNASANELKELGYDLQVKPRKINSFYMEKGFRGRFEKEGDDFVVNESALRFKTAQIEKLIAENPEKISPNVVLRPLYQQQILPNIAYVGGPGELAYWLEYKSIFDDFGIQFPILFPRNFISVIDAKTQTKKEKLGLEWKDFFGEENAMIKKLQENSGKIFELNGERKAVEEIFTKLKERIASVDETLQGTVLSELQKTLKGFDNIEQKASRSLKQQSENEIRQANGIREKLFPTGIPQERYDNFCSFYSEWGNEYTETLKKEIKPFHWEQLLLLHA